MKDEPPFAEALEPYRPRRIPRWVVRAAIVAVAIAMVPIAQVAVNQWRAHHWLQACMEYSPPPDRLVFEDLMPAGAVPPGFSASSASPWNPDAVVAKPLTCWENYWSAVNSGGYHSNDEGVVFLHAMESRSGNKRLVEVAVEARDSGGLSLEYRVWAQGNWFSPVEGVHTNNEGVSLPPRHPNLPPLKLRVFAGQADPKRPNHFTIGFEYGRAKGIIDGVLLDDDTVTLQRTMLPKGVKAG
jgi:hypothetical protein